MIAALAMALAQPAPAAPPPFVRDPPPELLFAAYDQCLGREVNQRLPAPISPEEVFDQSQAGCAALLDAYVARLTRTIVRTNIDYDREKARLVANLRAAVIPHIVRKRASLRAPKDQTVAENR